MERTVNEDFEPDSAGGREAAEGMGRGWQRSWRLLPDGLEHAGTGYFIEREVLGSRRRDGLWEWPLQISEKSWSEPVAFEAAFRAALGHFGIASDDDLGRSFGAPRTTPRAGSVDGFRSLADVVATPAVRARARRSVAKRTGAPCALAPIAARRLAEVGT